MKEKLIVDHKKNQNESEVICASKFLDSYNENHGTSFSEVRKNTIENSEIDVFCVDLLKEELLKVQVKKADPIVVGSLGRSRKISLIDRPLIIRKSEDTPKRILDNIASVEEKYKKQGKDMSDIILLLDEMMDPPDRVLQETSKKILISSFKEVWLVRRIGKPYRLF